MIDPKKDFQDKAESVKRWNEITGSKLMQDAALAAWAQFNLDLTTPSEMASSAANEWKRQGAKAFLQTLLSLTDKPAIPPQTKIRDLNRNA